MPERTSAKLFTLPRAKAKLASAASPDLQDSHAQPSADLPPSAARTARGVSQARQQNAHVQREIGNGRRGIRTRDLRRDRPSRARRYVETNSYQPYSLQAFSASRVTPLRMVKPIVKSTFGPRADHEMLSRTNVYIGDSLQRPMLIRCACRPPLYEEGPCVK